ncbi:MAG: hypothetical protein HYY84_20835 [Deltaproteobacteria bacterium]|nr:hypothetical protein [Deltaproteobacteria bacterium]
MRLFFPQAAVDRWLESGDASLDGDILRRGGSLFRLVSGVHFRGIEGGDTDTAELVGRVKDKDQLATLGVEVIAESAVLGEIAYIVTPGYLGLIEGSPASSEMNSRATDAQPVSDEDAKLLTKFLLEKA